MKKLILLISILFLVVNLSGAKIIEVPEAVGGVGLICGGAGGEGCTTSNDSDQVSNSNSGSTTLTGNYTCEKFQFSGNGDVTEFIMRIGDTSSDTDFVGQVWPHDSGNNMPDLDGSVMGEVTVAHADVGAPDDQLFTFATPIAVNGSTDYWVCTKTPIGSATHTAYYAADTSESWENRICIHNSTAPGTGSCYADNNFGIIIRGCLD